MPYFYETEKQIFVHAGVDEEAEEYWKHGTSNAYFINKYPATFGKFYKDIISGHISTSAIMGDKNYNKVYWDKENHFFIDGNTNVSKIIPVLKYDTSSGEYFSFEKIEQDEGGFNWRQYKIR